MSFPIPPEDDRTDAEVNADHPDHTPFTGLPYDMPDPAELNYSADFLKPTTTGGQLGGKLADRIRNGNHGNQETE